MKELFIKIGIALAVFLLFVWMIPTVVFFILLCASVLFRIFSFFQRNYQAKNSLIAAEADFLDADEDLKKARQNKIEIAKSEQDLAALKKTKEDALGKKKLAQKNAEFFSVFRGSNNLDPVIGFCIFLIFLSASISGFHIFDPIPYELPAVTRFWYRIERGWLGKDRAEQWLKEWGKERGEIYLPSKGDVWEFFDSWMGVFLSFFLLLFLFYWWISDKLEKINSYLLNRDKRENYSSILCFVGISATLRRLVKSFLSKG